VPEACAQSKRAVLHSESWLALPSLQRVWCVYECALLAKAGAQLHLVLPPSELATLEYELLHNFGAVTTALGKVDSRRGAAGAEADEHAIKRVLEGSAKAAGDGFFKTDQTVRRALQEWLLDRALSRVLPLPPPEEGGAGGGKAGAVSLRPVGLPHVPRPVAAGSPAPLPRSKQYWLLNAIGWLQVRSTRRRSRSALH
jgi:hypothetical protein